MKRLNHLDLSQNELRNARIQNLGSAPSSPVAGQVYFNTGGNTLYYYNGTGWVALQESANVADATTSTKGIIQLAGDLAGTATSPQIAAGVIDNANISASANIALSKLATDPLARANHTGTQLHTTISDFDTGVRENRLDQMAIPTASVDVNNNALLNVTAVGLAASGFIGFGGGMNVSGGASIVQSVNGQLVLGVNNSDTIRSFTITGDTLNAGTRRITDLVNPSGQQDAATKSYVDSIAQGLDAKQSVRLASQTNFSLTGLTIPLLPSGTYEVDEGDRILVKDQTNPTENGIYLASSGAWTRAPDMDHRSEVAGAYVFVESDSTGWVASIPQFGGPIGDDAITWSQFSSAGTIEAGDGLSKTGNTLSVNVGDGLEISSDQVVVSTTYPLYTHAGSIKFLFNGTTFSVDEFSDFFDVKPGGIKAAQLADNSVVLDDSDGMITGTLMVANGGTGATTVAGARTNLNAAGIYTALLGAGTSVSIPQATHGLAATRGLIVQVIEEATGEVVGTNTIISAGGQVTIEFGSAVAADAYRVNIYG